MKRNEDLGRKQACMKEEKVGVGVCVGGSVRGESKAEPHVRAEAREREQTIYSSCSICC